MKNAILLHGLQSMDEYFDMAFPAPGNAHWFPWLQKQLLIKNIYAETPLVPEHYRAGYDAWKVAFERCDHIGEDTILVGHSCGGGFLMRWLSENKDKRVGKVVLVAPWMDPEKDAGYKMGGFFEFDIDENLTSRTKGLTVFVSNDDHKSILETVKILEENIKGLSVRRFDGKKHFCFDDLGTEEFPELLAEVLS